jgi:hypothetical protein
MAALEVEVLVNFEALLEIFGLRKLNEQGPYLQKIDFHVYSFVVIRPVYMCTNLL